jgi:hypothetical protein
LQHYDLADLKKIAGTLLPGYPQSDSS